MKINELIKRVEERKAVSKWSKGVKEYALELLETIEENDENYNFVGSPMDKKELLNGAENWHEYSEGGCSLIYNGDIAERLATPSELKRTRNGELNPNSREQWIDTQTRALYQAERIIIKECK